MSFKIFQEKTVSRKQHPHQSKTMLMLRIVAIVAVVCVFVEIGEDCLKEIFSDSHSLTQELLELGTVVGLSLLALSRFVVNPLLREMHLRQDSEAQLEQSERTNRFIMDAFPDSILHVDTAGTVLDFRQGQNLGISFTVGRNASESLPPDAMVGFFRCVNTVLKGGSPQRIDIAIRNGTDVGHHVFNVVKAAESEAIVFIRDITQRKIYEERLEHLSTHDVLTGLYNRAYYEAEIERLACGRRYPVSIIIIDLDGLKTTNDTYGHAAGDRMICKAADILRKSFRAEDLVARTGGDEFTVLLTETGIDATEDALRRIEGSLERANALDGGFEVGMSIGYAMAENRECLPTAIKMADMRMYQNKTARKTAAATRTILNAGRSEKG